MGLRLSGVVVAVVLCWSLGVSAQEPAPELGVISTQSLVDLETSVAAEIARRAGRGDSLARQRRFERQLVAMEQEDSGRGFVTGVGAGAPAARDFWHFYAGMVPPGLDDHRAVTGFLGGAGRTWGPLFVAGDGHILEHSTVPDGYHAADAELSLGSAVVVGVVGFDASVGGVVPLIEGRLDVIPLVVLGFTRFSVGSCLDGFGCFSGVLNRANMGGGGAAVWRWREGVGIRAGARWTRTYGLAYDIGFVLAAD